MGCRRFLVLVGVEEGHGVAESTGVRRALGEECHAWGRREPWGRWNIYPRTLLSPSNAIAAPQCDQCTMRPYPRGDSRPRSITVPWRSHPPCSPSSWFSLPQGPPPWSPPDPCAYQKRVCKRTWTNARTVALLLYEPFSACALSQRCAQGAEQRRAMPDAESVSTPNNQPGHGLCAQAQRNSM